MTTELDFTWEETAATICERFARIAAYAADWSAVEGLDSVLTYRQLDAVSYRLATNIVEHAGPTSEAVGILMNHDVPAIAVLMAIIRAGKFYVPLDSSQPRSLLHASLAEAEAALLITDTDHLEIARAAAPDGCPVVVIGDLMAAAVMPALHESLLPAVAAHTPANLMFTSGSTGRPKGALRNHRRLLANAWYHAHTYAVGPGSRLALVFRLSGGGAVADIFGALLTGATLCLFDVHRHGTEQLIDWLANTGITFFHPPVPLFREILGTGRELHALTALRHIILAGQTVTFQDVEAFRRLFPSAGDGVHSNCTLVVRFALSEAGLVSQLEVRSDTRFTTQTLPVGYALPEVEIAIKGDDGVLYPFGEGEIVIGSHQVCDGYWKRPEDTGARFLPDPDGLGRRFFLSGDRGRLHADGLLEHLGRKDQMVKIRGYRVEIGAVEEALRSVTGVQDAVCIPHVLASSDVQLVGFVVACPQVTLSTSLLRRELASALASHEIPAMFIVAERLPLTPSGKIDRHTLHARVKNLGARRPRPPLDSPFAVPATPTQIQLADLWGEVLGWSEVGIHDNFLDLGGNSILAARVVSRLIQLTGVQIPPSKLLEAPTIAEMAALIDSAHAEKVNAGYNVDLLLAEIEHMTDSQAATYLLNLATETAD